MAVTVATAVAASGGMASNTREKPIVSKAITTTAATGISTGNGTLKRTSPSIGSGRLTLFPHVPDLELTLEVVPRNLVINLSVFLCAPFEEHHRDDRPQ
jgi:hypothetical protein